MVRLLFMGQIFSIPRIIP